MWREKNPVLDDGCFMSVFGFSIDFCGFLMFSRVVAKLLDQEPGVVD